MDPWAKSVEGWELQPENQKYNGEIPVSRIISNMVLFEK